MSRAKAIGPTSSPAPSAPEATRSVVKSPPRAKRQMDWEKVRVFDKPEYRLPYKLAIYQPRKAKGLIEPPMWLRAAIESGLVETGSPGEASHAGTYFEPLDGHPPARMNKSFEDLIAEGIANTLLEFGRHSKADKKPDKTEK